MKAEWKEELPLEGIKDISPVSGGDVNEAFKVTTTEDDIFFLLVQRHRPESFYAAEIAGLNEFENAGVTAPRVIASGEINGDAYLILSYLEEGGRGSQRELGQLVAKMHSQQQPMVNLVLVYYMKVEIFHLIIHGRIHGKKFY